MILLEPWGPWGDLARLWDDQVRCSTLLWPSISPSDSGILPVWRTWAQCFEMRHLDLLMFFHVFFSFSLGNPFIYWIIGSWEIPSRICWNKLSCSTWAFKDSLQAAVGLLGHIASMCAPWNVSWMFLKNTTKNSLAATQRSDLVPGFSGCVFQLEKMIHKEPVFCC